MRIINKAFVLLFISIFLINALDERSEKEMFLKTVAKDPMFRQQMNFIQHFWNRALVIQDQMELGDLSIECALCGIAINEIEAFIIENETETAIVNYLKNNVCTFLSGAMQQICNEIADDIPSIVENYENRWTVSVICVDLGYCEKPFDPHVDPVELPKYVINLDLPPNQRWKEICSVPTFQSNAQYLYNSVTSILYGGGKYVEYVGEALNFFMPQEYADEIKGCASVLGVPYGWLTLFNLGYEVSDACTSIVAQTNDGKILHARNMDFWEGMGFTSTLKNLAIHADIQKGNRSLFQTTTFAGYVGVLSGMKPNAFSVTIDTRFYPDGISELFYEIVAAITEKNASLVSFLLRDVFMNENDFNAALENLSNGTLIADVYYIMAGVKKNEGVVISRNREGAADVWLLNVDAGRWYEVQTNYDHWEQPPWFDNRVDPANNAMNAMGRDNLSLDNLFKVITVKPVLNIQTTYSILACPADGIFKTYSRYCPYPCVE